MYGANIIKYEYSCKNIQEYFGCLDVYAVVDCFCFRQIS